MEGNINIFEVLNGINVNDHTERKKSGGTELTYLSWPFAVAEVTKRYPDFSYEVKMFGGLPYTFDPSTGYMVFTSVQINGIKKDMWLPVMDGANKAMKDRPYEYSTKFGKKTCEAATMFDINKTIMRCLVKNLSMFGLGLYIYAGEDLPEEEQNQQQQKPQAQTQPKVQQTSAKSLVKEPDKKITVSQLNTIINLVAQANLSPAKNEGFKAFYCCPKDYADMPAELYDRAKEWLQACIKRTATEGIR